MNKLNDWLFSFGIAKKKGRTRIIKAIDNKPPFAEALIKLQDYIKIEKVSQAKSLTAVLFLDRLHTYNLKSQFGNVDKIAELKPEQAEQIFEKIEYNK